MTPRPSEPKPSEKETGIASGQKAILGAALLYTICIYGPMAAMSIGAGLVLVAWTWLRWRSLATDLRHFRQSHLFWPTLALAFACIWSLVWAQTTDLAFFGMQPRIDWIKDPAKAWHLFFPAIFMGLLSGLSMPSLRKVYYTWLGLGVASAILGIVQHYIPLYKPLALPDRGLMGLYHATGMTGFHLSFASIIGFPTAASLAWLALSTRQMAFNKKTAAMAVACVLLLMANVLTYSKISWIAVPATILFVILVGVKKQYRLGLLGLVVCVAALWSQSEMVQQRFTGLRSINDRYIIWQANIEMIKQQPLFGVGWHHNSELSHAYYQVKGVHSFQNLWVDQGFESHAHNNLLDQWATTGTAGLLAFLWWNGAIIGMAYGIYKRQKDLFLRCLGLGFVAGWLCLHLNGLTQTNFWDAKVLHQLGWVTAFTLEIYRRTNPSSDGTPIA